jgi:hypothetical protein
MDQCRRWPCTAHTAVLLAEAGRVTCREHTAPSGLLALAQHAHLTKVRHVFASCRGYGYCRIDGNTGGDGKRCVVTVVVQPLWPAACHRVHARDDACTACHRAYRRASAHHRLLRASAAESVALRCTPCCCWACLSPPRCQTLHGGSLACGKPYRRPLDCATHRSRPDD